MDDSFEVFDALPANWSEVTADGPRCLRPEWLAYEPGRLPGPVRVFARYRAGRLSVATVGTVVEAVTVRRFADPYRLLHDGPPGLAEPARPWAHLDPEDVLPSVLLMSPEYETTLAGPDAADPAQVAAFVDALLGWASGTGHRSVVVPYLGPSGAALAGALADAGFESVPLASYDVLRVDWTDSAGYLARLANSRHRRKAARELRRFTELPVRTEIRHLGPDEPALVELIMMHARRYGTPQTEEGARLLLDRVLDRFGSDRTVVVTTSHEDQLVAFSLFIRDGSTLVGAVAGTRYDAPYASECHFRVLFYEIALQAPRLGITEIRYGMGDHDTKRRRGCQPLPLRTAFTRLPPPNPPGDAPGSAGPESAGPGSDGAGDGSGRPGRVVT